MGHNNHQDSRSPSSTDIETRSRYRSRSRSGWRACGPNNSAIIAVSRPRHRLPPRSLCPPPDDNSNDPPRPWIHAVEHEIGTWSLRGRLSQSVPFQSAAGRWRGVSFFPTLPSTLAFSIFHKSPSRACITPAKSDQRKTDEEYALRIRTSVCSRNPVSNMRGLSQGLHEGKLIALQSATSTAIQGYAHPVHLARCS